MSKQNYKHGQFHRKFQLEKEAPTITKAHQYQEHSYVREADKTQFNISPPPSPQSRTRERGIEVLALIWLKYF